MIEYYRKADFKKSLWSGGETMELLLLPHGTSYKERNFLARLSSATLAESSSVFTHLERIRRFITPITHPFLLEVNGKTPFLLFPFEVFEFSGSDDVRSYGMSVDFNLMLSEDRSGGWMKTLKKCSIDEKNTEKNAMQKSELHLEKDDVFWMFSYFQNKVILDDEEYEMDEYSLLVAKDTSKDIMFSSRESLIYGCIKL